MRTLLSRAARWGALTLAASLVVGVAPAWTADPQINIVSGSVPGVVTVEGTDWSGAAGVALYQCADTPQSEADFWAMCDPSTQVMIDQDSPWQVDFPVAAVIQTGEPFPPGTVQGWGNGTTDCEAAGANCVIAATEDWQTFHYAFPVFTVQYGPLAPAKVVAGQTTDLTDGASVTVRNAGHRPGTEAMTYMCAGYGSAFTGACDPVAGSRLMIPADGTYETQVSLPRFVWLNDPLGHASWYDCVNGCSVLVASANNLASPFWERGVDPLITFRAVPLVQHPQLLTVTAVRVNRLGGITIQGAVNCTQAITAWGQLGSPAMVDLSWTARQPVGRKGSVTARYSSAAPTACYLPAGTAPFTWTTRPPTGEPGVWWVYPDSGGKFAAGKIHVDVSVSGGTLSDSPGAGQYMVTGTTQWDGKAVKG